MDLTKLSTEELQDLYKEIEIEFYERQAKLQEICEHPEYVDIMSMRPGAFYKGCVVCQKSEPRDDDFWTVATQNNEST